MKTLKEIIGEAVGQASMCWTPRPSTEVFNSEEANEIVDKTCQAINEILEEVVGERINIRERCGTTQCELFHDGYNQAKAEIRANAIKILGQ